MIPIMLVKYRIDGNTLTYLERHCGRGKASAPHKTADNRLFIEAVLWIVRTGSPWRDLPAEFGNWNSVFQRYRRWIKGGVFTQIFQALNTDPDCEYTMIDATIVKVHRHGQGAKGGPKIRP